MHLGSSTTAVLRTGKTLSKGNWEFSVRGLPLCRKERKERPHPNPHWRGARGSETRSYRYWKSKKIFFWNSLPLLHPTEIQRVKGGSGGSKKGKASPQPSPKGREKRSLTPALPKKGGRKEATLEVFPRRERPDRHRLPKFSHGGNEVKAAFFEATPRKIDLWGDASKNGGASEEQ